MIEYLIVFVVTLFATFQASKKKNKVSIVLWSSLAILLPSILAGLRDSGVGWDTEVYANYHYDNMMSYGNLGFLDFLKYLFSGEWGGEWIYVLLTYLSVRYGESINSFYFIQNFFVCLFTYLAIYDHRKKASMTLMMFIFLFSFYNISLNIMRQCIALSLALYSYKYFENANWVKLFIGIVLVFFCHGSGLFYTLVLFCIWMQCYFKFSFIKTTFIFLLIPFSFVCFDFILQTMVGFGVMPVKFQDLYSTSETSGGFMKTHVVIATSLYMLLSLGLLLGNRDKSYVSKVAVNNQLLYTMFLLSMMVSLWAFRISYYFYYFNILLIPMAIENAKINRVKYVEYVKYGVIFLILLEWFLTIVVANENSTCPYKSIIINNWL